MMMWCEWYERGKKENIWRGTHLKAPQGILSSQCVLQHNWGSGTCDLLMRVQRKSIKSDFYTTKIEGKDEEVTFIIGMFDGTSNRQFRKGFWNILSMCNPIIEENGGHVTSRIEIFWFGVQIESKEKRFYWRNNNTL